MKEKLESFEIHKEIHLKRKFFNFDLRIFFGQKKSLATERTTKKDSILKLEEKKIVGRWERGLWQINSIIACAICIFKGQLIDGGGGARQILQELKESEL